MILMTYSVNNLHSISIWSSLVEFNSEVNLGME